MAAPPEEIGRPSDGPCEHAPQMNQGDRPSGGRPSPQRPAPLTAIEASRVAMLGGRIKRPRRNMDQTGPPGTVSCQSPRGPERSGGPRRLAPGRDKWRGPATDGRRERGGGRLCSPARAGGGDGGERGGTLGRAADGRTY